MEIIIALVGFALGVGIGGFIVYSKLRLKFEVEAQTWKTKFELTQASSEQNKAGSAQMQDILTLQFRDLAQKIFEEK